MIAIGTMDQVIALVVEQLAVVVEMWPHLVVQVDNLNVLLWFEAPCWRTKVLKRA